MISERPAETTTIVISAIVTVIAQVLNITNQDLLAALPIVIGAIPAVVTWIVELIRRA